MENQGNEICRARFGANIVMCIIKGVLIFLIPFIVLAAVNRHFMTEPSVKDREKRFITVKNGLFTQTISVDDSIDIVSIRNFDGKQGYTVKGDKAERYYFFGAYGSWTKSASISYIILIAALGIYSAFIHILLAKRCFLSMNRTQIEGQLKTTFGKKKLQMPIDHVDSVVTSCGFKDKLRGGETLVISSNSGIIKFHYVRNADEFAAAAMKRIDEVKKSVPVSQTAPLPEQNTAGGNAMEKLNSLKQMLDSGLITQEEFEQKKQDILSRI